MELGRASSETIKKVSGEAIAMKSFKAKLDKLSLSARLSLWAHAMLSVELTQHLRPV